MKNKTLAGLIVAGLSALLMPRSLFAAQSPLGGLGDSSAATAEIQTALGQGDSDGAAHAAEKAFQTMTSTGRTGNAAAVSGATGSQSARGALSAPRDAKTTPCAQVPSPAKSGDEAPSKWTTVGGMTKAGALVGAGSGATAMALAIYAEYGALTTSEAILSGVVGGVIVADLAAAAVGAAAVGAVVGAAGITYYVVKNGMKGSSK